MRTDPSYDVSFEAPQEIIPKLKVSKGFVVAIPIPGTKLVYYFNPELKPYSETGAMTLSKKQAKKYASEKEAQAVFSDALLFLRKYKLSTCQRLLNSTDKFKVEEW